MRAWQLIVVGIVTLLTVGVVMVISAGMSMATTEEGHPQSPMTLGGVLTQQAVIHAGLAFVVFAVAAVLPVRSIAAALTPARATHPAVNLVILVGGGVALCGLASTVYWPVIGKTVNGAQRWVNLHLPGLDSVQPSELVKWSLVGLIAWFSASAARSSFGNNRPQSTTLLFGLLPALITIAGVTGFIATEDLGTAVLIALAGVVVLLAAGARAWHLLLFVPIALALFGYAVWEKTYRIERIIAFLDPYADPRDGGYHIIQSMAAIAEGGLTGRGLGHGLQKFGYLLEDTTDFLFAVICEELGLAGAALVVAMYLALLAALASIARREEHPLLRLFVLGVLATLGLQAAMNMLVVVGLGPTKGIALPLMSSGGTGWLAGAFMLGLVAAIDRTRPAAARWPASLTSIAPAPALAPTGARTMTPAGHTR